MRSKLVAILCLTIFLCALVTGCTLQDDGTVDVPIKVQTDKAVVAVVLRLHYDPAVLEATSVDKSTLTKGAEAAYDKSKPGDLLIVVTEASNLDQDGTLVVAHFKVLDKSASSELTIEFQAAEDRNTGDSLDAQVSDGHFDAAAMSVKAPVITIG